MRKKREMLPSHNPKMLCIPEKKYEIDETEKTLRISVLIRFSRRKYIGTDAAEMK